MSADLDKAIDRAVRQMLDREPRADMRARVIARIDARPASVRFPVAGFQRFAAFAGVAALLIVVSVLVLARRSERPAQPLFAAHGEDVRLAAPLTARAPVDVPVAPRRIATPPKSIGSQMPIGVAYATAIDAADSTPGIDPLKSIEPIEVAPIASSSITPEPIGVRPLNPIPEVQVAPLNPPDRRN